MALECGVCGNKISVMPSSIAWCQGKYKHKATRMKEVKRGQAPKETKAKAG